MSSVEKTYLIYMHRCVSNGKAYIGCTSKSMQERWNGHVFIAMSETPERKWRKRSFQNAIRKHGVDAWEHVILQDGLKSLNEANAAEIYWIAKFETLAPAGYNETSGGGGVSLGPEARERHKKATREALARPDVRARYLAGIRRGHSTDSFKRNNRIAQKIAQNRPDVVKKKRDAMLKHVSQPGYQYPRSKRVAQLDEAGNVLQVFGSATQAAKETGTNYSKLTEVARGLRKRSGGFQWKYLDNLKEVV